MVTLQWGEPGSRFFETGIDRGALYVHGRRGVSWTGLVAVSENPVGGEVQELFQEGRKYKGSSTPEEFAGRIEAFTYPDDFELCDGSVEIYEGFLATGQTRQLFDLSYRTQIGNDLTPDRGYKIHLLYNLLVSPSTRDHRTQGGSIAPQTCSWDFTATAPRWADSDHRPTAHYILDTRRINTYALSVIEDMLYGSNSNEPMMPRIDEVFRTLREEGYFRVVNNGDGSFTIYGSEQEVRDNEDGTFFLNNPNVTTRSDGSYVATGDD